jgi:hypothetical protein
MSELINERVERVERVAKAMYMVAELVQVREGRRLPPGGWASVPENIKSNWRWGARAAIDAADAAPHRCCPGCGRSIVEQHCEILAMEEPGGEK